MRGLREEDGFGRLKERSRKENQRQESYMGKHGRAESRVRTEQKT